MGFLWAATWTAHVALLSAALLASLPPNAAFTLDDLQAVTVGPLSYQTSVNICSIDGPPPTVSLSGPIPPEIGDLTNLTVLGLCHFNFSGSIPREIGNLVNLQDLNLGFNRLTGAIPKELGGLTGLRKLYLGRNKLTGIIPPELANLTSLELLELGNNSLTGPIPPGLGALVNLTRLELFANYLTGPIPTELSQLAQLSILGLQFNQLSGSIPPELSRLPRLTALALQNNRLTGRIPPELGNMVSLTSLYLWNNSVSGPIPSELGKLGTLVNLFAQNNSLTGPVPASLGQLTNLNYLVFESNSLSGPIPPELGSLRNLLILSLAFNKVSGPIPVQFGNLSSLTELYLQTNNLNGTIPPDLGNLIQLTALVLHENNLSGVIPPELANPPKLQTLALYSNNLTGTISPGFLSRFGRENVLPGNPFLSSPGSRVASPPPPGGLFPNPPETSDSSSSPVGIIAGAAGGAAGVALLALLGYCFYRRWKTQQGKSEQGLSSQKTLGKGEDLDLIEEHKAQPHSSAGSGGSRRPGSSFWDRAFTVVELERATGGWAQANVVGAGSFGTVYRATLSDGNVVAVKRLDQRRRARRAVEEQSWRAELATLRDVRHKNLVRLLGACAENDERLLILEFFPEGSLNARLQAAAREGIPFLNWAERMAVLEGVCRGLTYMHHDITPPLVHRDIKAANILLRGGGGQACIADFGLARLVLDEATGGETSSAVKGTLPYMAPEYMQGGYKCLSTRCDVYSFGVLTLELLTGRGVTDRWEKDGAVVPLVEYASSLVREGRTLEILDPEVWDDFDVRKAECCIQIALECLQRDPSARPDMEEVGTRLKAADDARGDQPGEESPYETLTALATGRTEWPAGAETGSLSTFSSGEPYKFKRAR